MIDCCSNCKSTTCVSSTAVGQSGGHAGDGTKGGISEPGGIVDRQHNGLAGFNANGGPDRTGPKLGTEPSYPVV
jgi:hypothetical protein